jgi:hypothetical protein
METIIQKYAPIVGKLLVVLAFLYFGIGSIIDPSVYVSLIPGFLGNSINPAIVVTIHGMVEVICALFILFNIGGKWPLYVLVLAFIGVLISVSGQTEIRDLAILGGLLLLSQNYIKQESN